MLLIKCSTEVSRGYGADEFKGVCEEFLAQFEVEPKPVVAKTAKTPKKVVKKPVKDDLLD